MEIWTIKSIKDRLLREYPQTRELLQPTQYFAVADISPDAEITKAFESVRKKKFLGRQYDWLPRFCKESGLTDIQLCVHREDKAHAVIEKIVSESADGAQSIFRADPKFFETSEYVLFRYFSFPILKLTKIQMTASAKEQGWEEIMGMTWFCHNPTNKMNPCGKCNPCLYTIEEGLGWRIPARTRMVSFFYRLLVRPLKSLAKVLLNQLGLLKYIRKSA